MLTDATVPGSPSWWLRRLESQLLLRREGPNWSRTALSTRQRPPLELLDAYLRGDPPLTEASKAWAPVMREYLRVGRMNLAELCVDSVVAKMNVLGFRTDADNDRDGDSKAALICRSNKFNIVTADVFAWMLGLGDGYMMVGPGQDDPALPSITAEHPNQAITSDDPITGRPRAALKLFRDDELELDRAYLMLPGVVRVASRSLQQADWTWDDELSFQLPANMSDVVPMRRFRNRRGIGEFEPHLDILDRINETLFDRLVMQKYQALHMRIFAGLPSADDDGNPIDYSAIFSNDPGSVVTLGETEKQIQMFETTPTDLGPLRQAVQDDMKAFAAATSTPLHLLFQDAAGGSAEGAALQREGGTWKVEDRRQRAEYQLAEVMGLAFRFAGDADRTDVTKIRTVWAPAERFSLAERYNAAGIARRQVGEPFDSIMVNVLQYTPDELEWIRAQRADDALFQPIQPTEAGAAAQAAGVAGTDQSGAADGTDAAGAGPVPGQA